MLDFLGHIAYIGIFVGQVGLARKKLWGWIFRCLGTFGWVLIGLAMGMTSIWIWGLVFMAIDIFGFIKWRKQQCEA